MPIASDVDLERSERSAPEAPRSPGRGAAVVPPPKLRRRPMLIAVSVAAISLGALLAAWAYAAASTTHEVVAVRESVQRGEVIGRDDVMVVRVSTDPALRPVPASDLDSVVGSRAAQDLSAGGLVTRDAVTDAVVPAVGMSVVGIGLASGMLPAQRLQIGDRVRIVTTPGQQGEATAGSPPFTDATVAGVRPGGEAGQTVVDVVVSHADAVGLAARAATGNVALVLDSRER